MPHLPQEELAAFVSLDWADATHDVCFQAVGDDKRECSRLEHTPEAIEAWARALHERFVGYPGAVCLEHSTGPLVSALRKDKFLVLFPVNPVTLAKDREAFAPSHAKDDPTDAELQLELLLKHRDKLQPLIPQRAGMRALTHLVEHRRRPVGDNVRLTNRLTAPLNNYFPHALQWFDDQDPTRFYDFLTPWPTLTAAQLARRTTLEHFFSAHHVRDANVIDKRIQALKSATPLTTDEGVIAPHALWVQALVAQRRVILQALADCDHAIAPRAQSHPDFPVFAALPGAGAGFAPRLLVAFGEPRERYTSAAALQKYAGIAPVTERRGKKTWVHWRWQCPTCLRQPFVEGAAESIRHAFWARPSYQQQRDKGTSHQAAVRALAVQWIRLLLRCWQDRTPSNASVYLNVLKHRGSPLLHNVVHQS
jgi:transposase